jgi:hypothetical protein
VRSPEVVLPQTAVETSQPVPEALVDLKDRRNPLAVPDDLALSTPGADTPSRNGLAIDDEVEVTLVQCVAVDVPEPTTSVQRRISRSSRSGGFESSAPRARAYPAAAIALLSLSRPVAAHLVEDLVAQS